MPMEKFIFDGPNKQFVARPEFVDTDGEMVVDVQEDLYSAWKDVVREGDNLKFLEAMRSVGGDPISSSQSLGATFFLTNGWRILPDAQDHRLIITGNIFTDPFGDSITDFPSAGVIIIENTVSNLVDSSVARLDLTQLLPAIFIDGDNGDDLNNGTPTAPVKTVLAARVLADADNLKEYRFRGPITSDQDHLDWTFVGVSAEGNDTVELAGFNYDHSKFTGCQLAGVAEGVFEAQSCGLNIVSGLDGIFRDCGLPSSFSIGDYAVCIFDNCFSQIPGTATPTVSFGTNSEANFRGYKGGLQLQDFNSAGFNCSVDLTSGNVVIDPSCTAGTIVVRGIGNLTDNSAGTIVNKDGLVEGNDARLTRQYVQNTIHIDTVTGNDATGNGSHLLPVMTLGAARILADAANIRRYDIHGPITLDQDHDRWSFNGQSAAFFDVVTLAGFSVDESLFDSVMLVGATDNSEIEANNCILNNLSGAYGHFHVSCFINTFAFDNSRLPRNYLFERCFSGVAGIGRPIMDFASDAVTEEKAHTVQFRNYAGGLTFRNMTEDHKTSIDLLSGTLDFEASCVQGEVVCRGTGEIVGEGGGALSLTDFLVKGSEVQTSRKILQGKTITNPDTGQIEVYDPDTGALLFTADIFEDADGNTAYSLTSTKIERREKLE